MITRLYFKDCLSFEELDVEFAKGLNIFTGASGAGKSIFIKAILSLFGKEEFKSSLGELSLTNPKVENEFYDIAKNDDIVIKGIKKEKVRFFLNNQSISKKNLNEFSYKLIKYLNLKDTSDFQSYKLIAFLDSIAKKEDKDFLIIKDDFDKNYEEFLQTNKKLKKIKEDESKLEDLKEYTRFEISKIESLDPKIDEYDDLQEIKRNLTKKEKIEESLSRAKEIFTFRSSVIGVLDLLEKDSTFFDESMNELEHIFEQTSDSLYELEDVNIDEVLTRIEKLSSLQKRFGSIKEALEYKEQKKEELESYENISFEKAQLEKKIKKLNIVLEDLSKKLSSIRAKIVEKLELRLNYYLSFLYLSNGKISILNKQLDSSGCDEISFELNGVSLDTISSGEYNRLRLALLSAINDYDVVENAILFLDEIDANLSGKESEAIANVLQNLSKKYQIFAISHQIHLSSVANNHFLVEKNNNISTIKLLSNNSRINELARMLSGKELTEQALAYAKELIYKNK